MKKLGSGRIGLMVLALLAAGAVAGCSGILPVPGGDDEENQSFYTSEEELKTLVAQLQPGMDKALAFSMLRRSEHDFVKLDSPGIMESLYGGSGGGFSGTLQEREQARLFLQSLEGYRFSFKLVDRELGFSSPIRIKTDQSGYQYTLTLIFREGRLFDQPILSGGVVDGSNSKTFFDYLTPGLLLSR